MSRKSRSASAVVLTAAVALGIPATEAQADQAGAGSSAEVRDCLRPILGAPHSADVVQAWIDGCRRAAAGCETRTESTRRAEVLEQRAVVLEENGTLVRWLHRSEEPRRYWLNTSTGRIVVVRGAV